MTGVKSGREEEMVEAEEEEGMDTQLGKVGEEVSKQEGCPGVALTTCVLSSPTHVTLVASPSVGGSWKVMVKGQTTPGQLTIAG